METIYIVNAYKWGNRENHSYTVGVFNSKVKAQRCAASHTAYRGRKYACTVEEAVVNQYMEDAPHYTKEVYKTKSAMCGSLEP